MSYESLCMQWNSQAKATILFRNVHLYRWRGSINIQMRSLEITLIKFFLVLVNFYSTSQNKIKKRGKTNFNAFGIGRVRSETKKSVIHEQWVCGLKTIVKIQKKWIGKWNKESACKTKAQNLATKPFTSFSLIHSNLDKPIHRTEQQSNIIKDKGKTYMPISQNKTILLLSKSNPAKFLKKKRTYKRKREPCKTYLRVICFNGG